MSVSSHRHSLSSSSPYEDDDIVHTHHHHHHSSSGGSSRSGHERYAGSNSRFMEKADAATSTEAMMKMLPQKALALALILALGGLSYSLFRANKDLMKQNATLGDRNDILSAEKAKAEASASDLAERLAALEKENAELAKRRDELFDQLSQLNQLILSEKPKESAQ
jgi:cell division protein FtsB